MLMWIMNLGFAGAEATITVGSEGLEYTLSDNQLEFSLPDSKHHYTLPNNKLHYTNG